MISPASGLLPVGMERGSVAYRRAPSVFPFFHISTTTRKGQ